MATSSWWVGPVPPTVGKLRKPPIIAMGELLVAETRAASIHSLSGIIRGMKFAHKSMCIRVESNVQIDESIKMHFENNND